MSTTKPRITVTLEPRSYEVLSRLSAADGQSMSKIVAGFVDMAVPSLERVVLVLERAKTAPSEVRAGLAASIARADEHLIPALLDHIDQADMFLGQLEKDSGSGRVEPGGIADRGGQPRRPGKATPALVTRGSGHGKTRRRPT